MTNTTYEVIIPDVTINRSGNFTLGVKFRVTGPCSATGILFQVDPSEALLTGWHAKLYEEPGATLIADKALAAVAPGINRALFDAPVVLNPGTVYLSTIFNPAGSFGFLHSSSWVDAMESGPIHIMASTESGPSAGKYGNGNVYPANEWSPSLLGTPTPIVEVQDIAPVQAHPLTDARHELAARLRPLGYRVYPTPVEAPAPPCLQIGAGNPWIVRKRLGKAADLQLKIQVVVPSVGGNIESMALLEDMIWAVQSVVPTVGEVGPPNHDTINEIAVLTADLTVVALVKE